MRPGRRAADPGSTDAAEAGDQQAFDAEAAGNQDQDRAGPRVGAMAEVEERCGADG